jgi:hypothetical protein
LQIEANARIEVFWGQTKKTKRKKDTGDLKLLEYRAEGGDDGY